MMKNFLSEQNDRDKKILTLRNRMFWLKKTFSDFSNINIDYTEEIAINLHVSAKFLLFKEMKKNNIKISISGEGSDEIFLGYSHLQKEIDKDYYAGEYLKNLHFSEDNNDYPIFINAKLNLCKKLKEKLIKNDIVF